MIKHDLTISSVGDVCFSTGMEGHNYDFSNWISDDVRDFLNADIQIGNLECVFYPRKEKRPSGFNLSEEDTSINAILNSGFNVLTLANNHISDYFHYKGIEHTVSLLKENNINYCGAGIDILQAQKPAILVSKGYKVGVFSRIHENSFENIMESIATETNPGAAPLCVNEIINAAQTAKRDYELDLVILAVHWGIQDTHNHTTQIHEIANSIINESDVDVILGSHSHCIQGVASINNKVICYGQGNFYFYPQILDDGILYDDSQDINRTSLILNFQINTEGLSLQAKVVKQNRSNVVVFIDNNEEKEILRKVFGIWKEDAKIALYFEYRLQAIYLDLKKLIGVFNNSFVRRRFFRLICNPKKLAEKIWITLLSTKYK